MNSSSSAFNPARFVDLIKESDYRVWTSGVALRKERAELVDWLRKKHNDDKRSLALADKLESCKEKAGCKAPACAECAAAAQDVVTKVTRKFLKAKAKAAKIVCVSIVPADGTCAPGQLTPGQHTRNVRRFKERLGRADVTWFLGGSDWSFNEHEKDRYQPHWSHHLYGFTTTTTTSDSEDLKKKLQDHFPKTD